MKRLSEIKKMQIQELANLLRGYPETQITLTMFRPIEEKEYTRTLTRRIILVDTVKYEPLDDHIAYIKVISFSIKVLMLFQLPKFISILQIKILT